MSADIISFTPEQEAAVKYRGGSLLVAAAAGSGKTKVLVERLLSRVEDGDEIDEFLVITYTRAAAAELRERILEEISERLGREPLNRKLRRQSMLCRSASIDTIHAFCTDVLRINAHLAGLAPDFRVADESESGMIKADILEDVLNDAYEAIGTSEDLRALVDMTSAGIDDKRLVEIVLDAHSKLQSNPNPRVWADGQIKNLAALNITDAAETEWGAQLITKARGTARYWHGEMARLREEMLDLPEFEKAYGGSVDGTISGLEAFLGALDKGWDDARNHSKIEFARAKAISGYDELKDMRKRCKAAMDKCSAVFECSSEEHIEDMRAVAPAVAALLRLVLDFDSAYSKEKRRRGVADFADLEHLALSLLIDGETGCKTELAREISKGFKEIMVDEYQDVNAVQELIFNAVSQDGDNLFMVGDVKQSIYRFRLADPSIFLGKYKNSRLLERGEGKEERGEPAGLGGAVPGVSPALVLLSKNFRSRGGILDFVNLVFSRIMSTEFGEMDYTDKEALIAGRGEPKEAEPDVEITIIDMSAAARNDEEEDEESPSKTQAEARFIARRIAELTGGDCMIPDGRGGVRRVLYSDIAILLRSVRNKAWQYAQALSERGIPADLPGGEGFFETVEVRAALSLLSVIDNPMQDIPLAAALRGPVYGFSPDELAAIRIGSRGTDFYSALLIAAKTDEKCAAFLRDMDQLRAPAPDMPSDRFIWHVYNKTGLMGLVGAMRGGQKRRENLILLSEYARKFEQNGYKGLFGFLTYLRGLQEKGVELAHSSDAPAADAVRIMSIHKSKGLEFPIVILADTSKLQNMTDIQKPLVIHQKLGVGAMRRDRDRRIEYPTLARMAVQSILSSEMKAEELRVLYVAMTRAREKLIITTVYANAGRELEKLSKISGGKIQAQALEGVRNMSGLILAPAVERLENGQWHAEGCALRVVSGEFCPDSEGDMGAIAFGRPLGQYPPRLDDEFLNERFSFKYPYPFAPDLPSKLTVTGLKGRTSDYATDQEAAQAGYAKPEGIRERDFSFERPAFIAEKTGLTAAERGTALHLAMQYIDYKNCGSIEGVNSELERLAEKGLLTPRQARAVDAQKITRFFESDIGKRVLNAENVRREFKFSLLCPAEQYYPGGGEDKILLQGVVDCFFEEDDGGLTIVDFKTDRVTPDTVEAKAIHYTPQLAAYSEAIERVTGKRVKDRVIYFFSMDAGRTV